MYDVLVAGWGPTGMIATCLLGRAGCKVGVFERYPGLYPLPRVGGLHDDVLRLFQEIGIVQACLPHAFISTAYEMVHDGDVIFKSPMSPEAAHGWPESLLLFQPYFEAQLDAVAKSAPSVDLFQGQTVVGVSQTSDHVEITVEDGSNGERRNVQGRYLIGCDGGNSFVRDALGFASEHFGFEQDWLVVDGEILRPRPAWPVVAQLCDPEQPGAIMQLGRYHRRWAFMIMPDETKEEAIAVDSVWRRLGRLRDALGATPDEVRLIRHASYRFTSLLATEWRNGRVFLAGDAAHQMPPYLGQGMCSGMRDAQALAGKLALVLSGTAEDRFLDTYQAERKPSCESAIKESIRVGRVVIERDPEAVRRRDAELKGAQRQTTRQLVGYRLPGLKQGFIDGRSAHARGAGEIFIQGRVVCDGRYGRFDDVVGRGFMIIARSGDIAAALNDEERDFWRSIGGRIATFGDAARTGDMHFADSAGCYDKILDEFDCDVMMKRSDYHVFGMYPSVADLPQALRHLRAQLGGTDA